MVDAESEAAARYAAERAVLGSVETYTSNERTGMMMAGGLTYLVGSGVASVGEEMILVGGLSALVAAGVLPETWGLSGVGVGGGLAMAGGGLCIYVPATVVAEWGQDTFWMGVTGVPASTMPERLREDWENRDAAAFLGEFI